MVHRFAKKKRTHSWKKTVANFLRLFRVLLQIVVTSKDLPGFVTTVPVRNNFARRHEKLRNFFQIICSGANQETKRICGEKRKIKSFLRKSWVPIWTSVMKFSAIFTKIDSSSWDWNTPAEFRLIENCHSSLTQSLRNFLSFISK